MKRLLLILMGSLLGLTPMGSPVSAQRHFQVPAGLPNTAESSQCAKRAQVAIDNCIKQAGQELAKCANVGPQTYNKCMEKGAKEKAEKDIDAQRKAHGQPARGKRRQ